MRKVRNCFIAISLGLCTPLLIWVGAGCAFVAVQKQKKLLSRALPELVCSIDSDCPTGYVCVNGLCVPES